MAPVYAPVPALEAYAEPEEAEEVWQEPAPRRLRPRRDAPPAATRRTPPHRPARISAAVDACGDALAKASSAYGNARVSTSGAGPMVEGRSGRSVPVMARIEYQHGGRTEVRSARVSCRLDQKGHVVAIR
jgi:hypothetical protein